MLGFVSGDEDAVASIKTKLAKKYDGQYTAFLAKNLIVEACEEKTVDAEIRKYFSCQIGAAIAPLQPDSEIVVPAVGHDHVALGLEPSKIVEWV